MDVPRRDNGDDGAMAIEFLLVIGVLIVVFLIMLQYAMKMHAERIATAAAEEGLAAAAAYDGSSNQGESTARRYLSSLGVGLNQPVVHVSRSRGAASVTVSGDVQQVIPFLPVHVLAQVRGPVERFAGDTR
jgi:Flp pilus assembly protein TadG